MNPRSQIGTSPTGGAITDRDPRQLELAPNRDDPVDHLAPPLPGYRMPDAGLPRRIRVPALCPYCRWEHACLRTVIRCREPGCGGRHG